MKGVRGVAGLPRLADKELGQQVHRAARDVVALERLGDVGALQTGKSSRRSHIPAPASATSESPFFEPTTLAKTRLSNQVERLFRQ